MRLLLARGLIVLLSWLPLGAVRALAGLCGHLLARVPGRRRERILAHLSIAFPELDQTARRRLMVQSLVHLCATGLECALLWRRSRAWVEARIVAVHGQALFDEAAASGRGLLLVGGHLGQWELAILFGSLRLPTGFLYKAPRSAAADRLLSRYRARFGAELIPTGGAALRRALRGLKAGGAIGLLFDQLPRGGRYVNAPFFGRPVATMTLPQRLAQQSGCVVLMGHCLRVPGGWEVVFRPVEVQDLNDAEAFATALNAALEAQVRCAPAQYLWHYPRFNPPDPDA
ncbi:MAG: lauroyl acyltransferase [Wenzhouxiangellaceae bacterium]